MIRTWALVLFLATCACSANFAGSSQTRSASQASAELRVSGDVRAMVMDSRGRRTGWEGHRVEEIPGCVLEAQGDENAEPMAYAFRWNGPVAGTFRLLLKARTDGDAQISAGATPARGEGCTKESTEAMAARAAQEWSIGFVAGKSQCEVELTKHTSP